MLKSKQNNSYWLFLNLVLHSLLSLNLISQISVSVINNKVLQKLMITLIKPILEVKGLNSRAELIRSFIIPITSVQMSLILLQFHNKWEAFSIAELNNNKIVPNM